MTSAVHAARIGGPKRRASSERDIPCPTIDSPMVEAMLIDEWVVPGRPGKAAKTAVGERRAIRMAGRGRPAWTFTANQNRDNRGGWGRRKPASAPALADRPTTGSAGPRECGDDAGQSVRSAAVFVLHDLPCAIDPARLDASVRRNRRRSDISARWGSWIPQFGG